MCSPIGHGLWGLTTWMLARPSRVNTLTKSLSQRTDLVFLVGLSLSPDLDLFPGILTGNLNAWHHYATHSIGWALLITASGWCIWKALFPATRPTLFLWGLLASGGHLLQDMLTRDRSEPFGIPLLWPLSMERFHPGVWIFPSLEKADISTLFSSRNLFVPAWETIVMGGGLLLVHTWKKRHTHD